MFDNLLSRLGYTKSSAQLARMLATPSLREEFLGVAESKMPDPDTIISDANKLANFASSDEYKVFAKEVWARSLNHLDAILDPATISEKLQFHRGALRASLDLLRLSYQARLTREQLEAEKKAQVEVD